MKDKIKRVGIIAIAALIMFSFAACSDDSGGPSGPPQGGGGEIIGMMMVNWYVQVRFV